MTSHPYGHQPVMVRETLAMLAPRSGGTIVDATLGAGGHSAAILPHLLPNGRMIAMDRDADALTIAQQRLAEFAPNVKFLHADFRTMRRALQELGITRIDGLIADLGMSSVQLDAESRGFSFLRAGPLDMRMDVRQDLTAEHLVNSAREDELIDVFERLGEERFARRIARRIIEQRRAHALNTTDELAELIRSAVPGSARHGRLHPATRVFQALRMAVNDELGALSGLLEDLDAVLAPSGRAVMITFHSLEDRMVKRAFMEGRRAKAWTVMTKKPLRPSPEEVRENPRARSAKLRAIEKA